MKSFFGIAVLLTTMIYATSMFAAGDAAAGKADYVKKCASCHGPTGEGKDAIAKTLKVELKHLGSKDVQGMSDADLKKIAQQGTGKMKPIKDLDDKSADNIVAYVRTLRQK
jgi:mono/diheme cytochrome c family protein